jgi:trk system potassium uptake protein TrkA
MKIIILGAGQVGGSLAETLVMEHHDITVVDIHADRLQEFSERLDIRTVVGRCSYPNVLRQAGAEAADMIIAVTDSDEANMVACQVAYSLFHIPKKIARIRSQHYFIRKELFNKDNLPIDVFISPENIITKSIVQSLSCLEAYQTCSFFDGELKLIIIKAYYGGLGIGSTIQEIFNQETNQTVKLLAIYREGRLISLDPDTRIDVHDMICFVAPANQVLNHVRQFKKPIGPCHRVIIAGGGNLGGALAHKLQHDYQVKLIDHNKKRCEALAESLSKVTVLCAEASDEELLINENIENTDIFISLTNDDEANILAAIQAKKLGAKTLMALINRKAYVDLIEGGVIQHILSPQYATIGSILTHVRQGDVVQVTSLIRGKAEALEIIIHGDDNNSMVIGRTVAAIKWPTGVTLFGIKRQEDSFIPDKTTIIEKEDHLLLLVLNKQSIPALEKLLQVSAHFF